MTEGETGYKVMPLDMSRYQRLMFYVPDSIRPDYAVVMYPGFANPPEFYDHVARLYAGNKTLAVITQWDDGRQFSEETMIQTAYEPVDTIKREIGKFSSVVGIGHSYGGERLLKAAILDKENRFSAVSVMQIPERLGKYIGNHSVLYTISKIPVLRGFAVRWAALRKKGLNVRSTRDQRRLIELIDSDMSLFHVIDSVPGYSTKTQLICSPSDTHVSHDDTLQAQRRLRANGNEAESIVVNDLYKHLTKNQMQVVFEFSRQFFEYAINGTPTNYRNGQESIKAQTYKAGLLDPGPA